MKRIHKFIVGSTAALAIAAAVTAVVAAPDGMMGAGTGMMGGMGAAGMMGGAGGMGMMQGGMGGGMMSEQGLAQLKTQLAITPQQESAWQAFATQATQQAKLMQATHEQHHQPANANTPAPDRMAQHLGAMAQHLPGMQAMSEALSNLYAVLTPEQRSIVDRRFSAMGQGATGARGMHG